ncbi:Type II secretion system protein J precursor [Marinobacterium sp. xm-g-59]|uniref:PulJ/GspJ family protein n=1 Tax=Marinobacterium sp. xm-g-59 TaxID=2497748 RepID=UPI0015682088|nr:type II secretion system protein GspJ [Marinobacterium sp. xm-g-59]NRP96116.1 Type II secretion system protein J precursor [Marinobacterium sp. xm-g-59]
MPVNWFSSSNPNSRYKSQGFTLIELMVALLLFGILFSATFQIFNQVADAESRSRESYAQRLDLEKAINLLKQDLLAMVRRPFKDQYGDSVPAFSLNNGQRFEFVRNHVPALGSENVSDLGHIEYLFNKGRLIRKHWMHLDLDSASPFDEQILLEGLVTFEIQVVDEQKREHIEWPSGKGVNLKSMPEMFLVKFQTSDGREFNLAIPGLGE